jgi:hypothetical protein
MLKKKPRLGIMPIEIKKQAGKQFPERQYNCCCLVVVFRF